MGAMPAAPWFASPADAVDRLGAAGYLADAATGTTAYLAGALEKPLLIRVSGEFLTGQRGGRWRWRRRPRRGR